MEIWKDIEGYGGTFQVSNLGRVKTFNYRNSGKEKVLKPKKHNKGYLQVQLMKGEQNKMFTIHRLVAQAFLPNPQNLPCVNHKDEDKTNNNVENLEWCDRSYNVRYSMDLHPERIANRKNSPRYGKRMGLKVNQYNKNGELIKTWDNSRTIQNQTGMSDWSIAECCRGKRHTAYGYIWQYAD